MSNISNFQNMRRFMTGKLLLKLDTVQYIISHHNVIETSVFLSVHIFGRLTIGTNLNKFAFTEGAVQFLRELQVFSLQNNILLHYWLIGLHGR